MVKCAHGAVIDATLVQSAAHPRRDMIIELDTAGAPKVNEDGSIPGRAASKLMSCTEPEVPILTQPGSRKAKEATLATAVT